MSNINVILRPAICMQLSLQYHFRGATMLRSKHILTMCNKTKLEKENWCSSHTHPAYATSFCQNFNAKSLITFFNPNTFCRVDVIGPTELDLKCLKMTHWNKTYGLGPVNEIGIRPTDA